MRFKKTCFACIIILICFLTYLHFANRDILYVALRDSLAAGQNPYGEIGYGYTDGIADYLKSEGKLKLFVKEYAVSGYTAKDVKADILNNKSVSIDGKEYNIRLLLREANLVTVSLGANDFMKGLSVQNLNLDNLTLYQEKIKDSLNNVRASFSEIAKYAKCKVIVLGYYNPFPILFTVNEKAVDAIFQYADEEYRSLCEEYSFEYISFYQTFKENTDFLPNPFDIHPNALGYAKMSSMVIDYFLK